MPRPAPLRIAVLLSGSGRTLQNLLDLRAAGQLDIDVSLVIASRPGLAGSERAAKAGLGHCVIDRRGSADVHEFSRAVFARCDAARVDLICLAGWLSLLIIPPHYAGRIMNIHPSLLPSFGGRGMYGRRVHQAVLDAGCKISGCTVHFVDATYDTGPIILQRVCPVLDTDTADDLAHRVFEEEKLAYPEALRLFQQGRLRIDGRRVRVEARAPVPSPGTPGEG
jgi:formyltetrahydrofolate-dependent phosphoribosylglycinamide formyltransferase